MNAKTDFKVPYTPNHALNDKDLEVVFFVGEEGINKYGFRTLEGILLTKELADHFQNEAGSDKIPSHLKRQRDLEKSRSKPLKDYFRTRKNTVLPGLSICLSHLKDEEEIIVGNRKMIKAVIPADCDRHIADGQNRTELFQSLLTEMPELATQTVGVKFLISDTDTLEPVTEQIKQLFSDLLSSKKANNEPEFVFRQQQTLQSVITSISRFESERVNTVGSHFCERKVGRQQSIHLKAASRFLEHCQCFDSGQNQCITHTKSRNG